MNLASVQDRPSRRGLRTLSRRPRAHGAGWNGVADKAPLGLFYGGEFQQLLAEAIGVLTNLVFVFSAAFIFFKIVDVVWGNHVTTKDEIAGLDITEMGTPGYVNEDSVIVQNAAQDHFTTFGPGVPMKRRASINASERKNVPVSHS